VGDDRTTKGLRLSISPQIFCTIAGLHLDCSIGRANTYASSRPPPLTACCRGDRLLPKPPTARVAAPSISKLFAPSQLPDYHDRQRC